MGLGLECRLDLGCGCTEARCAEAWVRTDARPGPGRVCEGGAEVQIERRGTPLLDVQGAETEESERRLRLPLDVMHGEP